MSLRQDCDYWNESQTRAFDWDDDEYELDKGNNTAKSDSLFTNVQHSTVLNLNFETYSEEKLPLHILISNKNLEKVLDIGIPKTSTSESPLDVIKNITLKKSYSLEKFRSLSDKTALIDAALEMKDGNAILTVILYLAKTLKSLLLYKILSTRPAAVFHYAAYLEARLCTNELIDLLTLTSFNAEMMRVYQMIVLNTTNRDQLQRKLENFKVNHQYVFENTHDQQTLSQHIKLLSWLSDNRLEQFSSKDSAITILGKLCETNWNVTDNSHPNVLCKEQEISQRQFEWIFLNVRAANKKWSDITSFFFKNNWLNKKQIKTNLNIDRMILRLHKHEAPVDILEEFLYNLEDTELSLEMGKKFSCQKFVVNTLISQKDRLGLIKYMGTLSNNMQTKTDEYFIAVNALQSLGKKWKN